MNRIKVDRLVIFWKLHHLTLIRDFYKLIHENLDIEPKFRIFRLLKASENIISILFSLSAFGCYVKRFMRFHIRFQLLTNETNIFDETLIKGQTLSKTNQSHRDPHRADPEGGGVSVANTASPCFHAQPASLHLLCENWAAKPI